MSSLGSGSDIDEFFDAEDRTPIRNPSHAGGGENTSVKSLDVDRLSLDDELDEETKRSSLERMRKAEENDHRRKKLEMMRSLMSDDVSSEETVEAKVPPPRPPQPTRRSADMTNDMSPEGSTSKPGGGPQLPTQPSLEASSEDNASPVEATAPGTLVGLNVSPHEVDLNLDRPNEAQDKLYGKQMPNFEVPGGSKDRQSDISPPVVVVGEDDKPEPDIVQSAKAATLRPGKLPPPRPPPPMAPPRRKRKNKPEDVHIEGEKATTPLDALSPEAKGLPTQGLPTPTSTVFNLTRDLEQSLDLRSATAGSRMVPARQDELSAKAELTDEEKVRVGERQRAARAAAASEDAARKDDDGKSSEAKEEGADEELPKSEQRPRSNSGSRFLTDKEILEMVIVLNLDTGETIPLSLAEEKLPRCVNPLSLHIMRRTKEYSSDSSLHKHGSDDEIKGKGGTKTISSVKPISRRTIKLKRFIGKTVHKIKSKADEVLHDRDGQAMSDDDDETLDGRRMIKIKAASAHKGPYDFDLLVPVQDLRGEQSGAVWTMKFSNCGRLLATGGQDNLLRIWVLKDAYAYFDDMRQKYSEATKVSPTPSQDSLSSQSSEHSLLAEAGPEDDEDKHAPFMRRPFCIFKGHTADLLDLSWSKNYFILSSSMDKTVRLWHASRKECLCCFQHIDFVTAIAFLPRDDRYFLSGSLDGKLRLWNIPDKKVALWNEVIGQSKLITAANFCLNGRFAVVGTYDGRCVFYTTEQLKYYTQIHVRSTRGKNARGRKVTGIEPVPGEDKILVTSNDSRVRLYDLRDLTLTCKFKGGANNSSQIKASFSSNGKYIICGSEDHFIYIWRTQHDFYKYTSARRDRNDFWEGIKAHQAVVTAAIFAPQPGLIIKSQFAYEDSDNQEGPPEVRGEVLVSADFNGAIKVFINKFKPGSGM